MVCVSTSIYWCAAYVIAYVSLLVGKVSAWLGCCIIMIENSTSQKITGWSRGHLIQEFWPNPGSSSVGKDNVTKPAGVYIHMNPIPTIHVYKMPAGFVLLSFLTVEDPGLGQNVWIKWPQRRPVMFLLSGVSDHYKVCMLAVCWMSELYVYTKACTYMYLRCSYTHTRVVEVCVVVVGGSTQCWLSLAVYAGRNVLWRCQVGWTIV